MVRIDMELEDLELISLGLSSLLDRMENAHSVIRTVLSYKRERLGKMIDKFQELVRLERKNNRR